MTPTLSLVVGTRNRREPFRRLVNSVAENMRVSTEIVVADASDPGTEYAVKVLRNDVSVEATILREWPPVGVVAGYNRVFRLATGEYVAWLNDDCEVTEGWDLAAVRFMLDNPSVGIGALAWCDEHEAEHRCRFQVSRWRGLVYANFGIIRRKLGDEVGWFDEGLSTNYGCDNSICCRVLQKGQGIVGVRDSKILHYRERDHLRLETEEKARTTPNNFQGLYDEGWESCVKANEAFEHLQPKELIG